MVRAFGPIPDIGALFCAWDRTVDWGSPASRRSAPRTCGLVSQNGSVAVLISCDDDHEAIRRCAQTVAGGRAELWQGSRRVMLFPGDVAE